MEVNMSLKLISFCCIAALLFPLSGCGGGDTPEGPQEFTHSRELLGQETTIKMWGAPEQQQAIADACSMALDEMERISYMLDASLGVSTITSINKTASGNAFELNQELFDLLSTALVFSEMSGGAFDITSAPLRDLWGISNKAYSNPAPHEIADIMKSVGYTKLILNKEKKTIAFAANGMKLDLEDFAYGYSINQASILLKNKQLGSFIIKQGNVYFAYGAPPKNSTWQVEITNPNDSQVNIASALMNEAALAVVGEGSFSVGGKVYSTMIDPRSGEPAYEFKKLAVISASPVEAVAIARMCFAGGKDFTLNFLDKDKHIGVLFVEEDVSGNVKVSTAGVMKNFFKVY